MIFKKINKWYRFSIAKLTRKKDIASIRENGNEQIRKIADVYEQLHYSHFDKEEKLFLHQIKLLREKLSVSDEELHFKIIFVPKESEQYNKDTSIKLKEMVKTASLPPKWGDFHFKLLRILKPALCLELGTNLGISGAYQCAALQLNKKGKLVTLEGNSKLAEVAERELKAIGFSNMEIVTGLFDNTLEGVLKKYDSFDYVFIDGNHQKVPTLKYFEMIKPYLSENAIVIFDDINWSEGMQEAWQEVSIDKHVVAAFDFYKLGLIIYNDGISQPKNMYKLSWAL